MQPLNDKQVSDFAATLNDQGDKSVFLDLAQKGDWKTLHGHFPDAYKGVKVETTTPPAEKTREDLDKSLASLIENAQTISDIEAVIQGVRMSFGDLFTSDDETKLRDAVKPEEHPKTREALEADLAKLPGDHTDPEYVINGLGRHYGDLLTEDDKTLIREKVKASVQNTPEETEALTKIKPEHQKAFEASNMSAVAWNKLTDKKRNALIAKVSE